MKFTKLFPEGIPFYISTRNIREIPFLHIFSSHLLHHIVIYFLFYFLYFIFGCAESLVPHGLFSSYGKCRLLVAVVSLVVDHKL